MTKKNSQSRNSASGGHPYHHGDLKSALLAEAVSQIAAKGTHLLSLREVARSAGVSHTASYRHFRSKEALLAAIAEQGFNMLTNAMSTAMQKHDSPAEAFQASGIAYVEFGVRHPEHLQVMFGGVITSFNEWPALKQAGERAYSLLSGAVHRAREAGQIQGDENTITLAAWSLVHGLTQLIVGGQIEHGKESVRHLAAAVTALITGVSP